MTKRIISAALAIIMTVSVILAANIVSSADSVTGLSKNRLLKDLADFIITAKTQIPRDDYENMPEGMQTKNPATVKLQSQIDTATALRKRQSEQGIEAELEAFLLDTFGGWDAEKQDWTDTNKPYGDFQNAMYLRYAALDEVLYWGEGNGYATLNREDYTIDSWEVLKNYMTALEKEWFTINAEYVYTKLAVATRSQVYYLLQDYYNEFAKLVKFNGDKELNKYRGLLYDAIHAENQLGLSIDQYLARCDADDSDPYVANIRSQLHLGEKKPAYDALSNWYTNAKQVYANESSTLEEVKACITTDLLYTDSNGSTVKCPYTEEELKTMGFYLPSEKATAYVSNKQATGTNGKPITDEKGNPVYETDAEGNVVTKTSTYHYDYNFGRNEMIQNLIDVTFTGQNARLYKALHLYMLPSYEKDGGMYSYTLEDDGEKKTVNDPLWAAFVAAFDTVDTLLATPEAKETEYYDAIKKIEAAYDDLMTATMQLPEYRAWGNNLIEYYKSTLITAPDKYDESFTNDEVLNTEKYDIDSIRKFRTPLTIYLNAIENIDKLQEGTAEYAAWEEVAKARVLEMIEAKAKMAYAPEKETSSDEDGEFRYYHNNKKVLEMAKTIYEKSQEYLDDIIKDQSEGTGKYPFPSDLIAPFENDVLEMKKTLSAIEKYEARINEGDASVSDTDAVSDTTLTNLITTLYFDLTNMQLEFYYEEY